MSDKILDYTDFCVNGTTLIDGQRINGLECYVSYGVIIHDAVDIPKLNAALRKLYSETDCFHMHLEHSDEGLKYHFSESISEDIHIIEPEGDTPEERIESAKSHVIKQSTCVRDRYKYSPFFAELFRIDENEYFLAAYIDRYVSDGHSIGVALMKLLGSYNGTVIAGGVSRMSMRDYVRSLDNNELRNKSAEDAAYWHKHLCDYHIGQYIVNEECIPAFRSSPHFHYIPKKEFSQSARKLKATTGSLLTAIYHLTIKSVFGENDNVISYVSTDRNTLDEWGVIGPFVKPLSSRVVIDADDTLQSFVKKTAAEIGENIRHKSASIRDIPLNRYGMSFLNHSKPFLTDSIYTQWMPDLLMDNVDASFIYLRMQELSDVIEIEFVCPRDKINRTDYENVIEHFTRYADAVTKHSPDAVLRSIIKE